MSNIFEFNLDHSGKTECYKCRKVIGKKAFRVRAQTSSRGWRYFHIKCTQPYLPKPINFETDVMLNEVDKEKDIAKVREWVETWNQQFVVTEEKLPAKFVRKAVDTTSTLERRKLLEVFAYLSIPEIEQLAAFTCKSWFHVTRDDSFWKGKYLSEFQPTETDADACYRKKYIAMYLGSCWLCHQFVPLNEMKLHCPLHHRPLCVRCSETEKGEMIEVRQYCSKRYIEYGLLESPWFPVFYNGRTKFAYWSDLKEALFAYFEKRRTAVLESIASLFPGEVPEATIEHLRNISLYPVYEDPAYFGYGKVRKLLILLGRNARKEDWKESLEVFIAGLKEVEEEDRRLAQLSSS